MGNCCSNSLNNYDKTTPIFSLEGRVVKAKVVDVYDGDTISCVFETYKNHYHLWKVRLNQIDTPELKTTNELEKQASILIKKYVSQKILNKTVTLHCGKFEKYGRLLGEVYVHNYSLNNDLVTRHFAYKYDGKTKNTWSDYDLKLIIKTLDRK